MTSRSSERAAAGIVLAAALDYAGHGWRVFPCAGKIPRTAHGCRDATRDPDLIAQWWSRWPAADVAVATGHGHVVLDVDGEPGADSLHELERAHSPLPATVSTITGGGGAHYFFESTAPVRNSAGKLGAGLDVRGAGGFVVVPPSIHASGRAYEWCVPPDECEVAPLPQWLLGLLTEKAPARAPRPVSEWRQLAAGGAELGRRNDSAARLAGHLLARKVDPYVVVELVEGWDRTRNRPPIGPDEVQKTVESIARRELARRR